MINPGVAVDAIVDALQHIPELVTAVGGTQNILAFHLAFPNNAYFRQVLDQMRPGQVIVRYMGTLPGNAHREMRIYRHEFAVYQVPPVSQAGGSNADLYTFLVSLIRGTPTNGDGNRLANYQMVNGCDIMDPPSIKIYTDPQLKRDFFCSTFIFPEIGDQ